MNFLSAGIEVVMVEREQAPLDRGVGVIRKNYENDRQARPPDRRAGRERDRAS